VLDYVEFLESRFAERGQGNIFTRFTETVEDNLRAGRVSAGVIAETVGLLNKAAGVFNGAVAAGKSVATDFASAAKSATTTPRTGGAPPSSGAKPAPGGPGATGAPPPASASGDAT